jgi:hypothetical protein
MRFQNLDTWRIGIDMTPFADNIIASFPVSDITRSTPAGPNIFNIKPDSPLLSTQDKEIFHSVVYSCLYLAGKVRKDISVAVAFLSGRVQNPTQEDWDKLTHLIQFLISTRNRMLILGGNFSDNMPKMYTDASYGVHSNGRSHTGISIHFNLGAVICKSIKQKVVSKSSAEAELIALSDGAAMCSWVLQFLEGQGYQSPTSIIFEDNKAAITLAENGGPTSERTRHIRIRHFFITQFLESKEMFLRHRATATMVADILTKYVGNPNFSNLADMILGYLVHINGV